MIEFLEPVTVKLANFQTRKETHGEALVPAADLSIVRTASNHELDTLIPGLREAFFTAIEREAEPGQGEMQLPVDELFCVRFPKIDCPIKVDLEQEGLRLVVDYGLGGDSDIVIALVKLHKVQITRFIEGGSCEYKFTLSSSCDIDASVTGPLSMLQQQEIQIKLISPEVEAEKPLTESDVFGAPPANDGVGNATEFAQSVEDAFVKNSKPGRKGKKVSA